MRGSYGCGPARPARRSYDESRLTVRTVRSDGFYTCVLLIVGAMRTKGEDDLFAPFATPGYVFASWSSLRATMMFQTNRNSTEKIER